MEATDIKKLKKYSSKQLSNMLEKAEGEKANIIREILTTRGIFQEPEIIQERTKEEILKEVRKNSKNLRVKFLCTKTKTIVFGIIKGVRLDKRTNFIQYRIKTLRGMFGKGIQSPDLVFLGYNA